MASLVGLSGSLRRGSFNTSLLRAAAAKLPTGTSLAIESIREFPLYDGDLEDAQGIPPAVARLKDAIAAADGLLIATPEYNNGIPGVAKNAIDWLSRPPSDIPRVFAGKPVALLGASPGAFGTVLSQAAWLPVLRTLGADFWAGGRLLVSRAGSVFDASGALTDERISQALAKFVEGFAAYADARRAARG
jgi:NAD(P)H-dependent FMN reductase